MIRVCFVVVTPEGNFIFPFVLTNREVRLVTSVSKLFNDEKVPYDLPDNVADNSDNDKSWGSRRQGIGRETSHPKSGTQRCIRNLHLFSDCLRCYWNTSVALHDWY